MSVKNGHILGHLAVYNMYQSLLFLLIEQSKLHKITANYITLRFAKELNFFLKFFWESKFFHCVKSFRGPHFPAFGLKKDQNNSKYRHFLGSVCLPSETYVRLSQASIMIGLFAENNLPF